MKCKLCDSEIRDGELIAMRIEYGRSFRTYLHTRLDSKGCLEDEKGNIGRHIRRVIECEQKAGMYPLLNPYKILEMTKREVAEATSRFVNGIYTQDKTLQGYTVLNGGKTKQGRLFGLVAKGAVMGLTKKHPLEQYPYGKPEYDSFWNPERCTSQKITPSIWVELKETGINTKKHILTEKSLKNLRRFAKRNSKITDDNFNPSP